MKYSVQTTEEGEMLIPLRPGLKVADLTVLQ